ncbi:efflux RND transporter permease subunit [Methylobacterium sp. WL116]|uniref:efflux RND transporter permease subunit n=1 Tax=Methylobacterium sp. WL116 TaxID=2603889 RepID=UPI001FEE6437|nr:efflux RND transporter permease subunit [Methylobacterium sp. WL116]
MVGAVERVRPKMMTVVAIMAGLLPILWSTGSGSEVMQRIAVPMIGGMLSSTVLTLVVIPAVYALVKGRGLRPADAARHGVEEEDVRLPLAAERGLTGDDDAARYGAITESVARGFGGRASVRTGRHGGKSAQGRGDQGPELRLLREMGRAPA